MRQRDCDPISFPRRKEIASPVKERTPKGDSSLPIRRIGNRIGAYGLRCSPFGNPFCERRRKGASAPLQGQPPRGRETKDRKRRGRRPRRPADNRRTYGDECRGDPCGRPRSPISFRFTVLILSVQYSGKLSHVFQNVIRLALGFVYHGLGGLA